MKPALGVLVLAGGRGARIGGGKPERTLAGYRLIDHVLHFARRSCGVVALGLHAPDQVDAPADLHVVLDRSGIEGPLASLAAGLTWAKRSAADYLLTLPCDAPFLPHDLGARLRMRLATSLAAAALPTSHGRMHPSCGLWRADAVEKIADYLSSGRRSLIGFAEHVGYAVEDWGAPARDPFFNINTPDDLAQAEAWLAQPHFE
ncbi:MAG: molybdenum cofactor guanylyltransferase [Hyphomonadaceae bacterium]|nr:molybdenum cofactor guanylyltransferase [Hyphomonadaceae bacterium]